MQEIIKTDSETDHSIFGKSNKKHAAFLKIYIKSGRLKLNIIPIPLWLAKSTISFAMRVFRFSMRFSHHHKISSDEVDEILSMSKIIFKEIRKYPPFDLVSIENGDTKVLIRTK